jgi:imidazolonepropionase-like amidohydrolase
MHRAAALLLATALAVGTSIVAQNPAPADLVITGVDVVDVENGRIARHSVVVRNGVIESLLAPQTTAPESAATIDGSGKFLIPGLWDMHVHLATRPEPELAETIMLPLFLAHGIVGVRDMGGPLDRVLAIRDAVKKGTLTGPRVITPGPFVDGPGDPDPMFRRASTPEEGTAAVRALASSGVDFIKVQAGLSAAAHAAVVAEAFRQKLLVAGHIPVAMTASDIIAAAQHSIEHISPALPGDALLLFACSSRDAELHAELTAIERDRAAAKPEDIRAREAKLRADLVASFDPAKAAAIGATLAAARTWIVPTLIWSNTLRPLHAQDSGESLPLEYVPAETRKRWQDARARYLNAAPPEIYAANAAVAKVSAQAVAAMHKAGARVLAGTDTFDAFVLPGASLHQELALLVEAGLTPLQALQTATRNVAEFRGTPGTEGAIAAAYRADLVLVDGNPLENIRNAARIHAVVAAGRVHTGADLDRLLDGARAAAK